MDIVSKRPCAVCSCAPHEVQNALEVARQNVALIEERDALRAALEQIEPMLIEYADSLPSEVEANANAGDWVCKVIMVVRKALGNQA